MGQFDSRTDAALAQLNNEALSETPGGEFADIIGELLMLVGTGGLWAVAGGSSNLLLKIRKLAGASYASNLVYTITAVRDDLADLYQRQEVLRGRIDSLRTNPGFAEAISALALRAMQTPVKVRLKRLAQIVVNGVKENDLEAESLDDMMRAAVELKDRDIELLGKIYNSQVRLLGSYQALSSEWSQQVAMSWPNDFSFLDTPDNRDARGSLARLQSSGLVQEVSTMMARTGRAANQPYGLLPDGRKFFERLQGIGARK